MVTTAKGRGEMFDEPVLRRLRALAATVRIERRAKIHAITAPEGADDVAAVTVCPVGGGKDVRTFLLPKSAVAGWEKWDRLTWRQRPYINERDVLEYADEPSPAAPVRTPNPGPEADELTRPRADGSALAAWVERFARAAYFPDILTMKSNDAAAAESLWKDVCAKTWILAGTVIEVRPDALPHVRLDRPAQVRAYGVDRARPLFGAEAPKRLTVFRKWGFDADVYPRVLDPQLGETIRVGDRVEVTMDFHESSLQNAILGDLCEEIRLWRITLAAPRDK